MVIHLAVRATIYNLLYNKLNVIFLDSLCTSLTPVQYWHLVGTTRHYLNVE